MVLLHGFGSHTETWRLVLTELSALGTVIAFDRPGFGLTERPLTWTGASPYSPAAQVDLVIGLLDQVGIQRAILIRELGRRHDQRSGRAALPGSSFRVGAG